MKRSRNAFPFSKTYEYVTRQKILLFITIIATKRSELETTINEAVNKIIGEMQKKEIINKEYITREEAARLLNVTIPTLHRYAKAGKIRIYKFGSRSLLKTEEVILAISENKIIKYGRSRYKK